MNHYLRVCGLLFAMLIYSSSGYAQDCNKGSFCKTAKCNTAQLIIKNQTSDSILQINSLNYTARKGVFTYSEGCCSENGWPPVWNVPYSYTVNPGDSIQAWGHEINGSIGAVIGISVYKNDNNTITQLTTANLNVSASAQVLECLWQNDVQNLSPSGYYAINMSSTDGSYSDAVATFTVNDAN